MYVCMYVSACMYVIMYMCVGFCIARIKCRTGIGSQQQQVTPFVLLNVKINQLIRLLCVCVCVCVRSSYM